MKSKIKIAKYYLRVNKVFVYLFFRVLVLISVFCVGLCFGNALYASGDMNNVYIMCAVSIIVCMLYGCVKKAYRKGSAAGIPLPRKRFTIPVEDGYTLPHVDELEAVLYLGRLEDSLEQKGRIKSNTSLIALAIICYLMIPFDSYADTIAKDQSDAIMVEAVPDTYSIGTFKLTAYCSCPICCGKWSCGPTKTGVMPLRDYTVAIDPSVIPLGTTISINGKEYVCEDTGSVVKGNHIDIYMDNHSEAQKFGVQYAEVKIKVGE